MANSLIARAPGREKPDLSPREEDSVAGVVAIVQWPDVDSEIDGVVSAIAEDIGSGKFEPGQVLVLTNWRKIGEGIRNRLNEVSVSARSFFTEEELAGAPAQEALALLRLTGDENDAPALRVLLGLGEGSGRSAAYQRLLAFAREQHQPPKAVLERVRQGEHVSVRIPAFTQIYDSVFAHLEYLRGLGLEALIDELLPSGDDDLADLRAVALDALSEVEDIFGLVRKVVESITQDDVPQNPDFVRIMSLHKSKGLTSPAVYVVGAVHGVLPTIRNDDPAMLEKAVGEGRRLFYVALTRAARELVISNSATMELADANSRGVKFDRATIRSQGGRHTVRTIATPYLSELGPDAPQAIRGEDWLASRGS